MLTVGQLGGAGLYSGRQREAGRSLWLGNQPSLHSEFQPSQGYTERSCHNKYASK